MTPPLVSVPCSRRSARLARPASLPPLKWGHFWTGGTFQNIGTVAGGYADSSTPSSNVDYAFGILMTTSTSNAST